MVNSLNPKFQMYVIDACQSGGKVLTRRSHPESDLVEGLIKQATGILFMYASTDQEDVKETDNLGHGIFTHYFLKALEDDSNYKDGLMSPSMLGDRISYETQSSTWFSQNPVIENRTTGFYPFAYLIPEEPVSGPIIEVNNGQNRAIVQPDFSTEIEALFPYVKKEQITGILSTLQAVTVKVMKSLQEKLPTDNFTISVSEKLESIGSYSDKVKKAIVENTISNRIKPIGGIFSQSESTSGSFSYITSFLDNQRIGSRERYNIHWSPNDSIGSSILFKSKRIESPNLGCAVVVYRAKFGLGVVTATFHTEWDGASELLSNEPETINAGFKIETGVTEKTEAHLQEILQNLLQRIPSWEKQRMEEIRSAEKYYQ